MNREDPAIDLALVERAQHSFRRVQIDDLAWHVGRATEVIPRGILVEAAASTLDADEDAIGHHTVGEQEVEDRVLRFRKAQTHGLGMRVQRLQINEELPRVVAHLRGHVLEPLRPERVDRRRSEPESLERPADKVRESLALGGEAIMLVCRHRHDDQTL